jgi:hypothetical protein
MSTIETLCANNSLAGFIKIWQNDLRTGEITLLVDKNNMILKGGAKLIAHALGGRPEARIWGMYIGYYTGEGEFQKKAIDIDYTVPFLGYADPFGYLREPLTFSPNYLSSAGYEGNENTVLFSTMITTATKAGGQSSADFNENSQIYEVALVSVPDTNVPARDVVFSRTNFNPIQYNSNYNFTITWGVRILVPEV